MSTVDLYDVYYNCRLRSIQTGQDGLQSLAKGHQTYDDVISDERSFQIKMR